MREDLRLELLKLFRTQTGAARGLEINEPRLSRILHGWVEPNDGETEKFKKLFGARKFSRLLRQIETILGASEPVLRRREG